MNVEKNQITLFHIHSAICLSEDSPSEELEEMLEEESTNANSDEEQDIWDAYLRYVGSLY